MASPTQFKVTKDEALILADALEHSVFRISNAVSRRRYEATAAAAVLDKLRIRLETFAADKRLHSSSKDWTFTERVRKYIKIHENMHLKR